MFLREPLQLPIFYISTFCTWAVFWVKKTFFPPSFPFLYVVRVCPFPPRAWRECWRDRLFAPDKGSQAFSQRQPTFTLLDFIAVNRTEREVTSLVLRSLEMITFHFINSSTQLTIRSTIKANESLRPSTSVLYKFFGDKGIWMTRKPVTRKL
jgi:hypothetical protein